MNTNPPALGRRPPKPMRYEQLLGAMDEGNCPAQATSRRPKEPHPSGGQHRSPAGSRTIDSLSDAELIEDHRRRLIDFEAELAAITGKA